MDKTVSELSEQEMKYIENDILVVKDVQDSMLQEAHSGIARLQIYSCIVASVLSFIAYLLICYMFTQIDLLEMIVTFICFILPVAISIPFYITED